MSLDLDAIKARCQAVERAIVGDEWRATHHPNGWHVEGAREEHPVIRDLRETVVQTWHGSRGEALAEFIAHARTDVPALIAEVERLREQAKQYRQWVIDANAFAYEAAQGAEANG